MTAQTTAELAEVIQHFLRWYTGETDTLPRRPVVKQHDERPEIRHVRPKGRTCGHRYYRLTCADYDDLVEDFGNACGVCSLPAADMLYGTLCIDHDSTVGRWAVRGLLCTRCNSRVTVANELTPAERDYLANPWYIRAIAARGLDAEPMPEPGAGAVVYDHCARRQWTHTERGWETSSRTHRGTATWRKLNYDYGPHNLEVIAS